jgi:CubicO group peptidase (beta-lactamase class C family)
MIRFIKRSTALILILSMLLSAAVIAHADEGGPERIWIRGFFEEAGAEVLWDHSERSITILYEDDVIILSAAFPTFAVINDDFLILRDGVILENARSYITARDLEAILTFGGDLGYLGKTIRETLMITGLLMELYAVPGMTIAIVDAEEGFTWTRGIGYADVEEEIEADEFTLFNLASISKTFTAVAVMQLAEAGLIDLDEPLVTYLPGFSLPSDLSGEGDSGNITVRMLLAHASGIHQDIMAAGVLTTGAYNPDYMNDFLEMMDWFLMAAPEGQMFSYANNSYTLLGLLIASVMEYDDFFEGFVSYTREFIFGPAGMELTTFALEEDHLPFLALPYAYTGEPDDFLFYNALPAGGIYSNAHDMAIFMHTILNGGTFEDFEMLSAGSVEAMFEKQDFGFESAPDFMMNMRPGLGIIYTTGIDGFEHPGHDGNLVHYHSSMVFDLGSSLGVFVSTNSITGMEIVRLIATSILQAAVLEKTGELNLPEPDPDVEPTDLDMDRAAEIEGVYLLSGEPDLSFVKVIDGELFLLNAFGFEALELLPFSDGSFYSPELFLSFWFEDLLGEMVVYIGEFKSILLGGRLEPDFLEYMLAEEGFEDWTGWYIAVTDEENGHVSLMSHAEVGIDENGYAFVRIYAIHGLISYSPLIHLGFGYYWGGIILAELEGEQWLAFSGVEMVKTEAEED